MAKAAKDTQAPLWGLPDKPPPEIRKGGSVLVITLSPVLSAVLQERSDEAMIDKLVLRILHEWADVPEETENG